MRERKSERHTQKEKIKWEKGGFRREYTGVKRKEIKSQGQLAHITSFCPQAPLGNSAITFEEISRNLTQELRA